MSHIVVTSEALGGRVLGCYFVPPVVITQITQCKETVHHCVMKFSCYSNHLLVLRLLSLMLTLCHCKKTPVHVSVILRLIKQWV